MSHSIQKGFSTCRGFIDLSLLCRVCHVAVCPSLRAHLTFYHAIASVFYTGDPSERKSQMTNTRTAHAFTHLENSHSSHKLSQPTSVVLPAVTTYV